MKLTDIFGSLRTHKTSLVNLQKEIAKLEVERGELLAAPPDKAAVLRWALRAVDRAETDFAQQLSSWYLNQENIGQVPGAWFDVSSGPRWLERQERCPGQIEDSHEVQAAAAVIFDRTTLMAILAPQLRELIPKWIAAHFPFQANAVASEERERRLAEIANRLEEFEAKRDELAGELSQARDEISSLISE